MLGLEIDFTICSFVRFVRRLVKTEVFEWYGRIWQIFYESFIISPKESTR